LLLYDITRGVDVGTKHDLYQLMTELTGEGKSILFCSSETEEMARLCHRVLVLREGRIAAELEGSESDAEAIVAAAVRAAGAPSPPPAHAATAAAAAGSTSSSRARRCCSRW